MSTAVPFGPVPLSVPSTGTSLVLLCLTLRLQDLSFAVWFKMLIFSLCMTCPLIFRFLRKSLCPRPRSACAELSSPFLSFTEHVTVWHGHVLHTGISVNSRARTSVPKIIIIKISQSSQCALAHLWCSQNCPVTNFSEHVFVIS